MNESPGSKRFVFNTATAPFDPAFCVSKKKECRMRFLMVLTAVLCALSVRAQTSAVLKPDLVHFKASMDNVKATFGPADPVAHVGAGGILEANSLDCFGNALQKPGDPFSNIKIDN